MARLEAGAGAPVKRRGVINTLRNVARLYNDPPARAVELYSSKQRLST
jgi:hypothetical protein